MGKRTNFERIARDLYETPLEALTPLLPYLPAGVQFGEPCAGGGALIEHLRGLGFVCSFACDIEPARGGIATRDAMSIKKGEHAIGGAELFITNPPWPARYGRGEPTLSIAAHLSSILPTWLLLAADFMHNAYAADMMARCSDIVPVGRVKWIPDSPHDGGFENAAWYKFHATTTDCIFHPRWNAPDGFRHEHIAEAIL